MLAFFVISLTIPTAFGDNGVIFACAYLAVIAVHTMLYMQSARWTVSGVWSFARMNMVAGVLILVGAIVGGATEYALWVVAVAIFAFNATAGVRITAGPPITADAGIAAKKMAIALPRSSGRYQWLKYTMTPGKKPASAAPSTARACCNRHPSCRFTSSAKALASPWRCLRSNCPSGISFIIREAFRRANGDCSGLLGAFSLNFG